MFVYPAGTSLVSGDGLGGSTGMKYVLTYESIEDSGPLFEQHAAAHIKHIDDYHQRGELLMIGPLQEPFNGDALSIFVSQESAEAFAKDDPIVVHGVIKNWNVRPWREVLSGD
ncbi:MAG TPA: YciI family protein [Jatrophihabitans sp.]|nr:YciI family protein [Jatrophihabitans sp.]